jgi:hypothetical protein
MPYTAEISRTNPSCFLFLVDQSASMLKPFGGHLGKAKAQGVADAVNRLLQNLVIKCAKSEGIRNYFYVGVIGYGGKRVDSALGGAIEGQTLVSVGELATHPLRVEERLRKVDDGAGILTEQALKFPVWIEPVGQGKTPMCKALAVGKQVVEDFVAHYPDCYPPVVINITDGEATDGAPEPPATALRGVSSNDGHALLFNLHLSSRSARPIEFPDREDMLPDDYARILFRMASVLPVRLHGAARDEGFRVSDQTRGFVFNADLVSVVRFMEIGTKVSVT